MSIPIKNLIENKIKLTLAFTVCFLLSFASMGQTEREKHINDLPRNSDHYNNYESPESNYDTRVENFNKNTNNPQVREESANKSSSARRENSIYKQGGEKDIKKENMSTLSFNLFLYIVDRFKED